MLKYCHNWRVEWFKVKLENTSKYVIFLCFLSVLFAFPDETADLTFFSGDFFEDFLSTFEAGSIDFFFFGVLVLEACPVAAEVEA